MPETAIARVPVADILNQPSFEDGDRETQVICNQPLKVAAQVGEYRRAFSGTGDGWIHARHVEELPEAPNVTHRVSVPIAAVLDGTQVIDRIPFGVGIEALDEKDGYIEVELPQVRGWIAAEQLAEGESTAFSPEALLEQTRKFLGTPYLWGGRTPFGVDCSGLVISTFEYLGYDKYTHNTDRQIELGQTVDLKDVQPGDLLFFDGHVAIYAGDNLIIHANLSGGGVTIDAITDDSPWWQRNRGTLVEIKRPEPAL